MKTFKHLVIAGIALSALLLAGCGATIDNGLVACPATSSGTDQGTSVGPTPVTSPYNGQVGSGTSYYAVSGLVAATTYTATLTNLTSDIDLDTYGDSGFSSPQDYSFNDGCANESALVTAAAGGIAYVAAYPFLNAGGTFTLTVQ